MDRFSKETDIRVPIVEGPRQPQELSDPCSDETVLDSLQLAAVRMRDAQKEETANAREKLHGPDVRWTSRNRNTQFGESPNRVCPCVGWLILIVVSPTCLGGDISTFS